MNVELLVRTPEALKVAFTAIRTCYSTDDQDYLWNVEYDKYAGKNDDHIRLVKQIVGHGHTSTLEHISFTFAITGVSRSLLAQLTRHRIGFSYSVQSQRYVKMSTPSKYGEFEYVMPPSINTRVAKEVYHDYMREIQGMYDNLIKIGLKPEDARYVLPNAAVTNITLTVNLRAFIDFYSKRNKTTHAQWEIAELAERMKEEIVMFESWTESLFEAPKPAEREGESFDFRKLFKKKFVRIMGNDEVTEEMVWKSKNHLYTMEEDGSFNSYSWEGFRSTLTPHEMKARMERFYAAL